MIEMTDMKDSHYNKAADHTSRIDRVFVACPRWLFQQHRPMAETLDDPVAFAGRGLSDHVLGRASLFVRRPVPVEQRPIPVHVIKDKRFQPLLSEYIAVTDLESLAPPSQYRVLCRATRA